ncbi:MAG: hypothetical protein WKF89_04475 [Chitinophagaceae bacterium]
MSLLKQILSPFVEFEDEKNKQPGENRPVAKPRPGIEPDYSLPVNEKVEHPLINGPATTVSAQLPSNALPGSFSGPLPEHRQYFETLIDQANASDPLFKGTDFKEFMDSKNDIDNITDEETRYRTAFNVLKRTGLTKDKLLSTAHEYHNIVGRDLNAFQSAHAQQYRKEVREREALIQKKAEELQSLSEKINALKKDIALLSQQMKETKDKLDVTKNSFLLAGENMQSEIQNELNKIQQYF